MNNPPTVFLKAPSSISDTVIDLSAESTVYICMVTTDDLFGSEHPNDISGPKRDRRGTALQLCVCIRMASDVIPGIPIRSYIRY
jgi:hypothetical protein